MKKILISLCFSVISAVCYSQVDFGIKSGMNIAITDDLIEFPENRIGWYVGGQLFIPIDRRFFIQTEILYSTKGQRTKKIVGAQDKSVTRLNYLNVPLFLGYCIDKKTSLLIGPELGWLTSSQLKYYNGDFMNVSKNYPSKFDIGFDIGINYRIFKPMGIEIRYSYGLNTLYAVDEAGIRHTETKGANRVFQIGINYQFNQ